MRCSSSDKAKDLAVPGVVSPGSSTVQMATKLHGCLKKLLWLCGGNNSKDWEVSERPCQQDEQSRHCFKGIAYEG